MASGGLFEGGQAPRQQHSGNFCPASFVEAQDANEAVLLTGDASVVCVGGPNLDFGKIGDP
jgi:hypothetical protein